MTITDLWVMPDGSMERREFSDEMEWSRDPVWPQRRSSALFFQPGPRLLAVSYGGQWYVHYSIRPRVPVPILTMMLAAANIPDAKPWPAGGLP